ncbi:2',3'-cyclic-nucleotide 2'-phosphodiesterase [Clostridium sp. P21]|uniref:2',3'-cyclic-nucleotide 2'-phosphodiesterase n=1 Tax=Clostridium muellerianum TaxID=2716538 RepID=A0A7Y0EEI1_9CLOT|nr:5'-nucleotidase C-terminal domain-containing protein [Clostridium muellerianum]NMM62000.1 2',3'-cyclic-nucleotide 2'-phosphodiesterase [Clostridium muellerianum]
MIILFKALKNKKWTAWIVAVLMVVSLFTPTAFTQVKASESGKIFDLIEITDFHGTLEDASTPALPVGAVLAKNISNIKNANPDRTLILGGGDLYQGSPMSNVLFGVPVQKLMSSIGMEVTALGNHEFDWGLDKILNTTMKDSKYSIVCANLYNKSAGKRAFEPYKIINKDGVKIAVIGAITTETPSIVLPSNVANYKFTDPTTEINNLAKDIKDTKKADVILALMHEGSNQDCKTGEVFNISDKLSNVDAVIGGHSHTAVQAVSKTGIPVVIGRAQGKGFIDLKMSVESSGKVSFINPTTSYIALDNNKDNGYKAANPSTDSNALSIVADAKKEVGPTFNEVIGNTDKDLTRKQNAAPYGESYLGNWVTDVIRSKGNADVGLQNNGGIRVDIPKGDITVGTIFYLMPFDNEVTTVNMNKAQLTKVFEKAFADNGVGIQMSGVKVNYDSTKPSGNRVIDIKRADGTAISDKEVLKVATNDFIATGGDGFTVFNEPSIKSTYNDTHILVRDALIENVRANKNAVTSMDKRIATNGGAQISIVGTSDVHGSIYPLDYSTGKPANLGLAKVSTYINNLRSMNPNVMLVDSGDTIQGTPLSYYYDKVDTKSEYPMMKVMGAMKYDSWTFGNHEFNYGLEVLNRVVKDAQKENINVLSANTYKTSDNSNFVKPYTTKTLNVNGKDIKVGILGLTTKCIPNWENASNYNGLKFNDPVEEAKKWVPILKDKEKADIVIVTIHSGEETITDTIPENQTKALATSVNGIDAIICGHAHKNISGDLTLKNPSGKVVPVTEPAKSAQYVSQLDININANGTVGSINAKTVPMDDKVAADPAITKLAQPYQDATLKYMATIIGQSTGEFVGKGQTIQSTALMDLINKVQAKGAGTQLSIAAPLSENAYIPKGDITLQNIMGVYVFENFLYGIKMNGAQLKKWMEFSAKYYQQVNNPNDPVEKDKILNVPDYNLDQLYGATYDIDVTQPACTVDTKTGEVKSGNRIKNLKFNGVSVKDTDEFTVAINNYRFNGGGGFMAAAGLKPGDTSVVMYDSSKTLGDDGQVRNMMNKYIQDNKTITPVAANNWKISTTPIYPFTVQTIKGADRYETAAAISKNGWEKGSDWAIIANGEVFADALCAAPMAKKYNAPILLTQQNMLPESSKAELERLNVKHVIIVGGEGSVSKTIENNIQNSLKVKPEVKRIYGKDRFETSVNIAKEVGIKDKAILVNGYNYPDALSVSSVAASKGMPIILTEGNRLPDSAALYINQNRTKSFYIIGLNGAVDKSVEASVDKVLSNKAVRLGGSDRFETNVAVMQQFQNDLKFDKMFVALGDGQTGTEFADGLSGSALAAQSSSPIMLVYKNVPKVTVDYINSKTNSSSIVVLLGGQTALPVGVGK